MEFRNSNTKYKCCNGEGCGGNPYLVKCYCK